MEKKRKVYLAFDIDGTIYDSADIVVDAFREGIKEASEKLTGKHLAIPSHQEILALVGIPAHEIYVRLYPQLTDNELWMLNDSCNASFVSIIRESRGKLFDGVYETMKKLHESGFYNLTASNGRREYIEAILETHDVIRFFSSPLFFLSDSMQDKSDIVCEYKKKLKHGDILIMIGDRESDRMAAINNSVPFIGCAYGHAGTDEIEGERWIVNKFDEVPQAIEGILATLK